MYSSVLETEIRVCDEGHLDTAATHNGLGNVHESLGKGAFHYGKAQEVFVAVYGDVHPLVADINIANVYQKQGMFEKSEMHGAVLETRTRVFAHPDVAKSHMGLGIVHERLGDYEKALFITVSLGCS